MSKDAERAMNIEELIAAAIFHCNYGKRTPAKEVALEFTLRKGIDEYRERAKETLLSLALNDPERLREFANALCWLKRAKARKRDKCPRGHDLVSAYAQCAFMQFPPTFSKVKRTFAVCFGEKKWNGGHDDDPTAGDYSARKTLETLKLPLAKSKRGRPIGKKSVRVLREGIRTK
jgi:hypothetical protein